MLLVVDNCEHVLDAAADLIEAILEILRPGLKAAAVVSSLVLMFCEDPAEELTRLRAHTELGGTLVASVLGPADSVDAFFLYWQAVRSVVPAAWSPDQYPHHRFADPQPLVAAALNAGWESIHLAPVRGRRRIGAPFAWEWLSGASLSGLVPRTTNFPMRSRLRCGRSSYGPGAAPERRAAPVGFS